MKSIFITGGASGLGKATAERFASEGWRVCIGDINEARGQAAANEISAHAKAAGGCCEFVICDVTRQQDLQKIADDLRQRWESVDVVINNAGVAQAGDIETVSLKDWQWIIDINLMGVVRGVKAFTPMMKQQGSGHFVNIASMAGLLNAPGMSAYNATKAAVVSISETMDTELHPAGIGTSVVCPSFFRTNLAESLRSTTPGVDKMLEKLFEKSEVTADDVANDIFEAVKKKQFYVLPHTEGSRAWALKRVLPRTIFSAILRKGAAKVARRRPAVA